MQCIAITKEGTQCSRKAEYGDYCWQHLRSLELADIRSYIKTNLDMKTTTEAEIFIDRIASKLLKELQVSTYEELFEVVRERFILPVGDKNFKFLISSSLQNQTPTAIRLQIMEATLKLLFSELRKLFAYEKIVNYQLVVRSIALNTTLNNLFERYSIPKKYIVDEIKTRKLPQVSSYTILNLLDGYDLSNDFVRFLEKYLYQNYNFVPEDRKRECGFTGNLDEFIKKWITYIKPYLPKAKLIKFKEGTDLVLAHDFWKNCSSARREETEQDLQGLVVPDVVNNILINYIT